MDRPKWHSKLIHIAVILAVVLSLVTIVLLPAAAQGEPELGVTVTTEKIRYLPGVYCVCDNFTVNATITNSGDATAYNVTANITWTPLGGASRVSGGGAPSPHTIDVGNITANSTATAVWVLHCDAQGTLNITVDVEEQLFAAPGDSASNWTEVNQREIGSDLTVTIFTPLEGSEFGVCTNFTLTFNVTNTGNITAYYVNARIDPSSKVNGVGYLAGQSFSTSTIASLAPNASHQWSVPMHCYGCDEYGYLSSIHVMPMGEGGCTGTEIQSEYLHSDIVHFYQKYGVACDAEPNPTKVCHNVTFTVTLGECAEYPVSWNWTFGDGNSTAGTAGSSPFTTTYHYNATNNYTAVVNVVDNVGINGTCNVTVEVFPTLNVTCAVAPFDYTKVCHNLTFTGTAGGGFPADMCNYTWTWDFDDGTTFNGTGKSPIVATHHFNATNNYTVTLTLMDDCLNNTANCTVDVEVFPALNVSCNVSSNVTKVCHNVTFSGTAIGGLPWPNVCDAYNWTWDLGDDTVVTGDGYSSGNVSHHYMAPGNYTAIFVIGDYCWNNTATCNVTVEVFPGLNLTCDAEPRIAHVCHAVNFSANLTGGIPGSNFTWNWTFGDPYATPSNPNTSTEQNPSHIYMCVGNYTANVTVCDDLEPANCANCTVNVTVIIEPPELISPINNAQLTSKNVTFEWEDIGCCNYTLEIWQKDTDVRVCYEETGHDNQWTGCIFDGNWRWRVTATDTCNNTATSVMRYFQMDAPEPSVTVQGPNGGETLVCNSIKSITWTATPTDATIEILYSSDGGGTWTQIASGEVNDGAYPWTVPCIESDLCLVKVIARDACQGEGADTSDGAFTITTATLVSIADVGVSVNGTINATIQITNVTDLAAADIWLSYNNSVVTVLNVTDGTLGGITFAIDNPSGVTKMNYFSGTGQTGDFIFAYVTLKAVGSVNDTSPLDLDVKALVDADGDPIAHATDDGVFTILALMEGDASLNDCVSIADAMFIAQYLGALRTLNADQLTCADTTDDAAVSIADALHIAQWLVDPDGSLGVLGTPLWESPADDSMLVPLAC